MFDLMRAAIEQWDRHPACPGKREKFRRADTALLQKLIHTQTTLADDGPERATRNISGMMRHGCAEAAYRVELDFVTALGVAIKNKSMTAEVSGHRRKFMEGSALMPAQAKRACREAT